MPWLMATRRAAPCLAQLDPGKLAGRGRFGLTLWKLLRMAPKQLVGLLGAWQFLMRSAGSRDSAPRLCQRRPLAEELSCNGALSLRSGDYDANTHGIRAARGDLQRPVGPRPLHGPGGVAIAAKHRRRRQLVAYDDPHESADERRSAHAGRQYRQQRVRGPSQTGLADPDQLLRGIHEEMDLIKRLRLGFTFVFSTAICRRFLGGLEKKVRADKCTISCIFTNLGTLLAHVPLPQRERCIVAGNVTLELGSRGAGASLFMRDGRRRAVRRQAGHYPALRFAAHDGRASGRSAGDLCAANPRLGCPPRSPRSGADRSCGRGAGGEGSMPTSWKMDNF